MKPRCLALTIVVCALGCVTSAIGDRQSVTTIVISGQRNLGSSQVRITDPDEIEQILALVQKTRRGFTRAHVSFDIEDTKVVRIQIVRPSGSSDLTMVSGIMLVPGDQGDVFYNPENEAQTQLWDLLLARLESARAP